MISAELAGSIIVSSLMIVLATYIWFSTREGTYVNVMTPMFIVGVPANFLLQLVYINLFGTDYSFYAYMYVYSTLAVANLGFVVGYAYCGKRALPKPFLWSNRSFTLYSVACLGLAGAIYSQVLLGFKDIVSNPREIYTLTRTGFGHETFVSTTLAYLAIIFILFTTRSLATKALIVIFATGIILLHGSKAGVVDVLFLLLMYLVYVKMRKIALVPALVCSGAIAGLVVMLFAATMTFADGPADALQSISQYSDYTRNAMLVIDSRFPIQYGRLTLGANIYAIAPRVLMPNKPKDFGEFYLAEEFYPDWFDADTGSPAFGIGLQYADFGYLAILYLALFSVFEGYVACIFINRLKVSQNPADFIVVAFLAGIALFPVGSGWLFPEALVLAAVVRFFSGFGAPVILNGTEIKQSVGGSSLG